MLPSTLRAVLGGCLLAGKAGLPAGPQHLILLILSRVIHQHGRARAGNSRCTGLCDS